MCAPRDLVVANLAENYAEAPVARGLTISGAVIEVFASADGKTWTLIRTTADGLSCSITAGTAWINDLPKIQGPDA